MAVDTAIYLKDAQRFLDECVRTHETVKVRALAHDGTVVDLKGWRVSSSWWRGGAHNFINPASGEVRKIRDILIVSINDHPIYM